MTTASTAEQDDFDKILSQAENLPDDPLSIVTAVDGMSKAQGEQEPAATEDDAKDNATKGDAKDGAAGEKSGEPPAAGKEGQIDGVLTKDGLKVLPYGALHAERRRADEAERRAKEEARQRQELESRMKDLESRLRDAEKATAEGDVASQSDVDSWMKELAELRDAVPELAAPLEKFTKVMSDRIAEMQRKVESYEKHERTRAEREAAVLNEQVQEAIDRNATLRYLQAQKNELWEDAAVIDKALRENPLYADYTYDERFAEVVRHLERRHGKIELPPEFQDPEAKGAAPTQSSSDKQQARTEAKSGERPMTLTDLPGGAPPADAATRLENMTNAEREAAMAADIERGMNITEFLDKWA